MEEQHAEHVVRAPVGGPQHQRAAQRLLGLRHLARALIRPGHVAEHVGVVGSHREGAAVGLDRVRVAPILAMEVPEHREHFGRLGIDLERLPARGARALLPVRLEREHVFRQIGASQCRRHTRVARVRSRQLLENLNGAVDRGLVLVTLQVAQRLHVVPERRGVWTLSIGRGNRRGLDLERVRDAAHQEILEREDVAHGAVDRVACHLHAARTDEREADSNLLPHALHGACEHQARAHIPLESGQIHGGCLGRQGERRNHLDAGHSGEARAHRLREPAREDLRAALATSDALVAKRQHRHEARHRGRAPGGGAAARRLG